MKLRIILVGTALAASASLPPTSSTHATPPETSCPSSNEVLVVAELVLQGYQVPSIVDAEGNGNGRVCGKAMNPRAQENFCPAATCPVDVVYLFSDDDRG